MIINIVKALPEFHHILFTHECWRKEELLKLGIKVFIINRSSGQAAILNAMLSTDPYAVFHHWYPEGDIYLNGLSSRLKTLGIGSFLVIHTAQAKAPNIDITCYIAVSEFVRILNYSLPSNKITVVQNAIDTSLFSPSYQNSCYNLVKCCRLFPERIPDDFLSPLIDIVNLPWHLYIIGGDGPCRTKVEDWINSSLFHNRITLVLNRIDVPRILKTMDIYYDVNADNLFEAWGCSVTEAMASGLAIVSKNKGAIQEQITDGVNGFLCGHNSEVTYKLKLLMKDNQLALKLGTNARERVVASNSLSHLSKNYKALL